MSAGARCVFVTGGTGFVGTALVERLLARGDAVHVLARARTVAPGARAHAGDVTDAASVHAAVAAAAGAARASGRALDLVHLAAGISYRRADRARLEQVNVEGTRHVLAAAARAGVRRFLHVSSVVALGPVARADERKDDDADLGGLALASAYAATKARAEELALAASRTQDVVVASPAVVFGIAGTASNSLHFLARAVRGGLGPLAPPGSLSVVALADTIDGLELVLARGRRGTRYLLAESSWPLAELLGLACRAAGTRPPRASVPAPLWRAVVATASLFDRLRPAERVTPESLALLGMHFCFEARRARAELGWKPRPFPEVLVEIVSWLAQQERP